MTTKTTGAEFKRFYGDDAIWNDDMWHEDEIVCVDDVIWSGRVSFMSMRDDAKVTVSGGYMTGLGRNWDQREITFETYFKRWRRAQNTTSFVVECDKATVDSVKAAIKAAGGVCR